ncbi:MAG: endonuclease/exonuclease/phosphatase [Saprospiraceae bacterium]|nr:endonuclease/exonuclease/phosphatase [Saprospiraceae bacterium]MBK8282950.1 endonuclease/exonuclease/phosphatase [Saprospiraceae bacterium]MBK9928785.1 endonuclease/exonuclease/phosphatase [Saprospiraceae bacterium]
MATLHNIYWWNLENLFDVQNSPRRPEWLQKELKSELKNWDEALLDKKIANLCSVIKKFNQGLGPDILGVCEIENEFVVKKLMDRVGQELNRSYKVLHKDTKDQRGIDISIIYDQDKYHDDGRIFTLEIMKRSYTRDLFQVNLTTTAGNNELILIGNHWPSRLGGKFESEPYRMMVGEILSYWVTRIHEIKLEELGEENPAIIVMGDFNDQPYDRSITNYLNSTSNLERVKNARTPVLFNTMFPFLNGKLGTHVFGNEINILDQFIVSKSLTFESANYPFQFISSKIIDYPELVRGDYNTPIRFSRPSSSDFNSNGFSDHLPIELIIKER